MILKVLFVAVVLIVLVVLLMKWMATPRKFARSLAGPLVLNYKLEKMRSPSATEVELARSVMMARMSNPVTARGLTITEAEEHIRESSNIADVLCAICIRDLVWMRRYETVNPAVFEPLKYLVQKGYDREVYSSKAYQGYEKADPGQL